LTGSTIDSRSLLPNVPAAGVPAAFTIARIDVHVLRCPIATPVRTSFGVMHDRPAVLVRLEDTEGAHGWGEVWCNFPSCGAEHRARLVETVIGPLAMGARFESPPACFEHLQSATAVLALQTGEHGPIAQAIAGVDLALWDLISRRAGLPLWRVLGGNRDDVAVYASGINPDAPEQVVARQRAQGYRAFKLKIGFGRERDLGNLERVRQDMSAGESLMVDANQAWDLAGAHAMIGALERFDLGWIEEPLRADRPWSDWQGLRDASRTPLAAGENVAGEAAFEALIAARALGVVQPDIAKWGGISGTWPVVRRIREAGLRYCPHFLGAGVGLLHSAHLLAAAGGDGMLEIDANPNPLRSLTCGAVGTLGHGRARLGDAPGIGVAVDIEQLQAVCAGR